MNKPWTILKEIADTDSNTEKQAILAREAEAGNDDFFKGLRLAYDNMITFGVKKVEPKAPKKPSEAEPKGITPARFFELANRLAMRDLTGDAALAAISFLRNQATKEEWDGWYRLILMKDLKAGFGETTINKVCEKKYPQYVIPVFGCQLAKDSVDDSGNVDESLFCGVKLVEVKLDGVRVLTVVYPNGKVDQYSRNGKELVNFDHIKKQIAKHAVFFAEPVVLDGEIMSSSFQDLMKQARRKTDVQAGDSVLYLFDILTLREFQNGKGEHRQLDRTFSLKSWFETVKDHMPNVEVVGSELVDLDTPAGKDRFVEINKEALAGKFEGVMLKDPEAVYECRRSKNWLKAKPFLTFDLTVVDVEEGKEDSKFVGTMGALVCEGVDQGRKIRVNVGSGFNAQLRAQLWADHTNQPVTWKKKVNSKWETYTEQPTGNSIIGQVVEVRADMITKSQADNDIYSLRFPRFKTFRGFTPGEKM